jgi:hypothetical protein
LETGVQLRFLDGEIQTKMAVYAPFRVTSKTVVSVTESVPDYTFFAVTDGDNLLVLINID